MSRLVGWFLKQILRLLSWLPLFAVHGLARVSAVFVARMNTRMRNVTRVNIRLCFPALSVHQQEKLIRDSLKQTLYSACEMPMMLMRSPKRLLHLVREVHGEAAVRAAFEQGRGLILLAPHIGQWEIASFYVKQHYPLMALYKPLKNPVLDALVCQSRERSGVEAIPATVHGVKQLFRGLKQGKVLGILPDQIPGDEGGEFAPFFGVEAFTTTLSAKLAQKTQAPTFLVYFERLPHAQGFRGHFLPINEGFYNADLTQAVASMNRDIEQLVRQKPSQYCWDYKRFKKQPAGQESIAYD